MEQLPKYKSEIFLAYLSSILVVSVATTFRHRSVTKQIRAAHQKYTAKAASNVAAKNKRLEHELFKSRMNSALFFAAGFTIPTIAFICVASACIKEERLHMPTSSEDEIDLLGLLFGPQIYGAPNSDEDKNFQAETKDLDDMNEFSIEDFNFDDFNEENPDG